MKKTTTADFTAQEGDLDVTLSPEAVEALKQISLEEKPMLTEPNCSKRGCLHFRGVSQPDGTEMTERVVCDAFPDGIPDEIAYGDNLHLKPFPGDHGIQFQEKPSAQEE